MAKRTKELPYGDKNKGFAEFIAGLIPGGPCVLAIALKEDENGNISQEYLNRLSKLEAARVMFLAFSALVIFLSQEAILPTSMFVCYLAVGVLSNMRTHDRF